ncbi:hypothetical protein Q067_02281 [Pseudomonas aeruginosa BL13]|nr:hypothetical protein Q067_02281 [Pseudomonas aeruginosa BL13]
MWLINRLKPDFKTIADFRKNNKAAFVATCRAFVQFCRTAGLIAGDLVAIDGSKFQAVASARRHLNQLKRKDEKLDKRKSGVRYWDTVADWWPNTDSVVVL